MKIIRPVPKKTEATKEAPVILVSPPPPLTNEPKPEKKRKTRSMEKTEE